MSSTSPSTPLTKPQIAVGSCLIGASVRFNGSHKRHNPHIEALREHLQFISICPEVGIGMGVPREPIRIVDTPSGLRAKDSKTQTKDYTDALEKYAQSQNDKHPQLCGYVFVKGSPSCGLARIPRYNEDKKYMQSDAAGIYAAKLQQINPLLPVEEDGRLFDPAIRESFINRVYLLHAWQQMLLQHDMQPSVRALIGFYTQYKYLVMAHSVAAYKEIGRLLAKPKELECDALAQQLITAMMSALQKPANRKGLTNTLQHIQGYLKNSLTPSEKALLTQSIDHFRQGIVPLVVPITLMKNHFQEKPDPYIENQVFMNPHPETLGLRSHII